MSRYIFERYTRKYIKLYPVVNPWKLIGHGCDLDLWSSMFLKILPTIREQIKMLKRISIVIRERKLEFFLIDFQELGI